MKKDYLCPHCRGHLGVGEYIVLKIRNKRRNRGLMLLMPENDSYTGIRNPNFKVSKGERIDFFCPLCMQHLDAAVDENMIQLIMIDAVGEEQEVFISRQAGELSRFRISDKYMHYLQN